jgi:hypothetical protein
MAAELVDRMAILVALRRFSGMGDADSRSLRSNTNICMYVCSISFVELLMFLFGVFGGMCGENLCNVFLLLFMVFWVPIIFVTICTRALLMLWHAFLFLGLRLFHVSSVYLVKSIFFQVKISYLYTLPIKSVTSGTHLISRHAQPRWPCNSIGG